MFTIIKPGTRYDFIGKARTFVTISPSRLPLSVMSIVR